MLGFEGSLLDRERLLYCQEQVLSGARAEEAAYSVTRHAHVSSAQSLHKGPTFSVESSRSPPNCVMTCTQLCLVWLV